MAPHDPQRKNRLSHCRLTGQRAHTAHRLCFRALLALAVLAFSAPAALYAQSGRRGPQDTSPATKRERPKRVVTTDQPSSGIDPGQTGAPQPTPAPQASTSSKMDEGAADNIEIGPEDVVRINSNLVPVPVSVLDERGRAITDLQLKDFELRVDGITKEISDISRSDTPVRMVLLFDNSSSLNSAREFEKQAAIRFFKHVMRPIDQAAIYAVSTVPTLEQPLTSSTQTLVRTIEHFGKPEGATALFDAMAQAAAYLHPLQGRKVIVIVSDGADTISDLSFEQTLERVLAADCQIYAVQTGISENANLRDLAAERRLEEFSAQTGGAVYIPKGTSDLDEAFTQIAADLAQQYILSYYPSGERRDGRFRLISLRIPTHPNARVRTRKGYYSPKG